MRASRPRRAEDGLQHQRAVHRRIDGRVGAGEQQLKPAVKRPIVICVGFGIGLEARPRSLTRTTASSGSAWRQRYVCGLGSMMFVAPRSRAGRPDGRELRARATSAVQRERR